MSFQFIVDIRFSVIIPCYNQGAFLEECLTSICRQTRPVHEAVVVDDGSTDPYTIDLIDTLCARTDWTMPVRLVRQANRGLSGARNSGIRAASGNWLITLDADDQLDPASSEIYASEILDHPEISLFYPDMERFGGLRFIYRPAHFNPYLQLFRNLTGSSICFRKEIAEAGILYREDMKFGYEDWAFVISACVEHGYAARCVRSPLFKYRAWGFSMVEHSNLRRREILAQIHSQPIFRDERKRLGVKREFAPAILIPFYLRESLGVQTFQDFKILDLIHDLGEFVRGRSLLVAFDQSEMSRCLDADCFFLEKLAYAIEFRDSDQEVIWLTVVDRERAYVGGRIYDGLNGAAVIGALLLNKLVQEHKVALLEALRGETVSFPLISDWADKSGSSFIAGQKSNLLGDAPLLPYIDTIVDEEGNEIGIPPLEGGALVRFGVKEAGKGFNKVVRGAIGTKLHDRISHQLAPIQRLRKSFDLPPAPEIEWELLNRSSRPIEKSSEGDRGQVGIATLPVSKVTDVPKQISFAQPVDKRSFFHDPVRMEEWKLNAMAYSHEFPLHLTIPNEAGKRRLFIAMPWVLHGGADKAVIDLVRWLAAHRQDVEIYLLTTLPAAQVWADRVIPHITGFFPLGELAGSLAHYLITDLVRRLRPETLFIMNSQAAFESLPTLKANGYLKECRVVTQHHNYDVVPNTSPGSKPGSVQYVGYHETAANKYNSFISTYTVISDFLRKDLVENFYVSPRKIVVTYLGTELERFAAARRERFADPVATFLWIGRMSEQKNPLQGLRIMKEVCDQVGRDRIRFIMAGDGPLMPQVRALHASLGLQGLVDLAGPVNDPIELYRRSDALLMSSEFEGIPLVVYEAMAAGLPVVACRKDSAIDEILNADNSILLPDNRDVAGYISAISRYVNDPPLARSHAERLMQLAENYTTDEYAEKLSRILLP